MQELEKILEEIDVEIEKERAMCEDIEDTPGWRLYEKTMRRAKDIIRKHMNDNNPCGECSRRKWYQIGYKDGMKNSWIPVDKDNIPENKICACDRHGEQIIGYLSYDSDAEYFICENDSCIMLDAIAWKPLDEPCQPERSDNHDEDIL